MSTPGIFVAVNVTTPHPKSPKTASEIVEIAKEEAGPPKRDYWERRRLLQHYGHHELEVLDKLKSGGGSSRKRMYDSIRRQLIEEVHHSVSNLIGKQVTEVLKRQVQLILDSIGEQYSTALSYIGVVNNLRPTLQYNSSGSFTVDLTGMGECDE